MTDDQSPGETSRSDRRHRSEPTVRPASIRAAFAIYLTTSLLTLASSFALLYITLLVPESVEDGQDWIFLGTGLLGIVVGVIIVILAIRMRRGGNAARILLTIVSGIQACNVLFLQFDPSAVLNWIAVLLFAASITLMWLPASNAYMSRMRARRSADDGSPVVTAEVS